MGTPGTVMTGDFEILGQRFNAINGGPTTSNSPKPRPSSSTARTRPRSTTTGKSCTADGGAESQCGWVKDKFGVSWQIVPRALYETVTGKDQQGAIRATQAMLKMQKLIVADLEAAYAGKG